MQRNKSISQGFSSSYKKQSHCLMLPLISSIEMKLRRKNQSNNQEICFSIVHRNETKIKLLTFYNVNTDTTVTAEHKIQSNVIKLTGRLPFALFYIIHSVRKRN